MTVARIKLEIERMLNLIPDGIQYEYHQQLFTNTTNRTKGNSEGGEVEDDVNSVDTGSENDNEHDEVDVQNDVDIDVVLDHDDSEKNKPNHAKPKPGKFKAGKLSAAQILNNKVQAKRMAKSRIMNKLKKLKNKLLTEQPYEPVEVLYVVYERTTKKFKYDGSGFLLNRFENCRPLSSGIPRKKVTERKGGCQQLHINKDKGVQFLTPKKYMYPFAPSDGKSLAEKQKAEIDGLNIQVEKSEVIISKKKTRIDATARKRKLRGKKALPRKRNTQKRKRAETESDTEVFSVNDDEVISDINISDSNEDMEDQSENNEAALPMLNDTSFSEKMSEVTESLDLHLEANGLSFIDLVNITMNSEIEADIHAPCTDDKPTSSKKRVTPQACQVIEADIHAPCTDDKPTSSKKRVTPQACQVIEADIHAPCTDDKPTSSKKRVTPQACQVVGKTNETFERYTFNICNQSEAENIDTYVSKLRKLAKTCNYQDLIESLIRDRIVCGIRDNTARKRLLQEDKLTLNKCIDICRALESTSAKMKTMTGASNNLDIEDIKAVRNKSSFNKHKTYTQKQSKRNCSYCGKQCIKG
ncbi:unnamed protein product [Mytilus coruscus]|uniref:Uncharacterized protein n=1 Tax=Mytilus coruscus TaxID=42192 RepID=A0A6J8CSY9_MYTCO|nr:unnamed protein product [Mytilus coruscus]